MGFEPRALGVPAPSGQRKDLKGLAWKVAPPLRETTPPQLEAPPRGMTGSARGPQDGARNPEVSGGRCEARRN